MKEKIVKLNEKEVETLKEALDNHKISVRIKARSGSQKTSEEAINELYNLESVEKKLK